MRRSAASIGPAARTPSKIVHVAALHLLFGQGERQVGRTGILAVRKWPAGIASNRDDATRRQIRAAFERRINIQDRRFDWLPRVFIVQLGFGVCLAASMVSAFAAGRCETETLRIAVYDLPPYGYVDSDGSMSGVSSLFGCGISRRNAPSIREIQRLAGSARLLGQRAVERCRQ